MSLNHGTRPQIMELACQPAGVRVGSTVRETHRRTRSVIDFGVSFQVRVLFGSCDGREESVRQLVEYISCETGVFPVPPPVEDAETLCRCQASFQSIWPLIASLVWSFMRLNLHSTIVFHYRA